MKLKLKVAAAGMTLLLATSLSFGNKVNAAKTQNHVNKIERVSKKNKQAKKVKRVSKHRVRPYADPKDMRKKSGNYWRKASETKKKYPNLRHVKNLNIRVSIKGNRTYIRSGKKVLYTMYSSAGKIEHGKSLTPRGTYHTNSYHPYRFSSAYYPVGWIGQLYLFHSVPTYLWSSRFNLTEARKLGKKPASHGCVRLSVSDAKWLHYHVPYRTKVIIRYN